MATVQVWVVPLDVPPEAFGPLTAGLSQPERRRMARYRFPDDARRFAAGRGWLRHVLGAELDLAPADVEVVDGGKPRLARASGPCFNLSRSGELALVAVSPSEVGVDVEHHDGGRALEAAPLVCTPAELAALDRLAAAGRAEAFLRLWTAKEAYLKAMGVGLATSPRLVEVGFAAGDAPVPVGPPAPRWWVRRLRPRPGYLAAVAAQGEDWEICLRDPSDLPRGGVIHGEAVCG